MGRLRGKTAVITVVVDTTETVEDIKKAGGTANGPNVTLTSDEDIANMAATTEKTFGRPDILVNNASIFAALEPKSFLQIDNDEFDKVMTVNLRGVHQATRGTVTLFRVQGGNRQIVHNRKVYWL